MKPQKNSVLVLVSDKFSEFAKNSGVMTHSKFLENIKLGTIDAEVIIVGQGYSSEAIEQLQVEVNNSLLRNKIALVLPDRDVVDNNLVHKRNKKNVVISNLCKVNEMQYKAKLLVDERCDEMADHMTGQHIQGTLLIEAARQLMMAALETENFNTEEQGEYSYVLNQINVNYSRYLFPVNAEMICTIKELSFNSKNALSTDLYVEVHQNNEPVCSVDCKVTGYPKRKLEILESREAKKNLRGVLNHWNEQVNVDFVETQLFPLESQAKKLENA